MGKNAYDSDNKRYVDDHEFVKEKENPNRFLDTHGITVFTSLPCNGVPRVIFEDLTANPNRSFITVQNTGQAQCRATVIIETDNEIIKREIPPSPSGTASSINLQLKNFRRLIVSCQGNPLGFCNIFSTISKTFLICCPELEKEECSCCSQRDKQTTCFIDQHFIRTEEFTRQCDGSTVVIFEDFTVNHNKTAIIVRSNTRSPCTASLIIETKDSTIIRDIPPQVGNFNASMGIEVEDLRRISVRCQGNPTGTCNLAVTAQKTFCICSTSSEKRKD
jgi:hypothetical protein